jgi:hypothetical protein
MFIVKDYNRLVKSNKLNGTLINADDADKEKISEISVICVPFSFIREASQVYVVPYDSEL